jgi:signal transduction histidine kinase
MLYALLMVPVLIAYKFLPTGLTNSFVYNTIALSCLLAILAGIRINKPAERLPWYLLAFGIALWLAADCIWSYFEFGLHIAPFPSISDALYLVAYPFFAAGIYLMVRKQAQKGDRSLLIDAAIFTIGTGVLAWMFLMDPYAQDKGLTLVEKLVSIGYPMGTLLVLSVLVRVFLANRARSTSYILLAAGLLMAITSDMFYGLMLLEGTYFVGHVIDFGWLLFYVVWGVAALHPSMGAVLHPDVGTRRITAPWRLWLIALVAILAPTVALIQLANGDTAQFFVVTSASVVIFLLVIWRTGGVLSRLESAHTTLRRMEGEKGKLLDRTMQIGEEERVRVATELHDGPIHQLSAVAYRFEAGLLQLERGDHESAAVALAKVRDSFGSEIETLREMMRGLRPPELDERGLQTALQDQLSAFRESSGIHGSLEMNDVPRLPKEIETGLFRITQEALENVAKHSRGRTVHVELCADDDGTELTITDDGVGFDPSHSTSDLTDGQFGLIAMRQHIEALGGRFTVTSSTSGTQILARFENGPAREDVSDPSLVSSA